MTTRAFALMVLVLLAATRLSAIFMPQESKLVPISRLVSNLEREIKANPKDVQLLINLARLHAMAFALKTEEFPAIQSPGGDRDMPFYGFTGGPLPPEVRPAPTPEQASGAARHLKEAIRNYEAAVALAPDNPLPHLGLGWVLQQAGDMARAVEEYRRVIKLAWPSEESSRGLMPGQSYLTAEAITYLLPELNPTKDAAEIADLEKKRKDMNARGRAITPITIPLADDVSPHEILDDAARVKFDADGSALDREWTWITDKAGWLVYDATGRGEIRSALQLFGNVTFWLFWSNGYEALCSLDDNGDRALLGTELNHLAIWHDRNSNGISEAGEVRALAHHGIAALTCGHVTLDDARFAAMSRHGVQLTDGRTRPTYDVILRTSVSKPTGVPFHQLTNRSLTSEQSSMNAENSAHAIQTWAHDKLLWSSSEIKP
jgi:tetratricopeptide (TPR) repeat protein